MKSYWNEWAGLALSMCLISLTCSHVAMGSGSYRPCSPSVAFCWLKQLPRAAKIQRRGNKSASGREWLHRHKGRKLKGARGYSCNSSQVPPCDWCELAWIPQHHTCWAEVDLSDPLAARGYMARSPEASWELKAFT